MKLGIDERAGSERGQDNDPLEFMSMQSGPAAQMGSIAERIGTRNLLIIIVTMPFVFFVVVMGVIAIFGAPGGDEDELVAEAAPAAAISRPVAALEEPPLSTSRVVLPINASAAAATAAPALQAYGEAGAIALDGDRLAVRFDGPDGATIVIYDLRTDEVVKTVDLTTPQ